MSQTGQKILGYLKIIDNSPPIFSPGSNNNTRLIKRRDEIVLEVTKRDDKKTYYKDDPTAKYFMKKPCDIKGLIPPTECGREIEIICGQDICDLTGFGTTVNINPGGGDGDGDDDDGGGGGGGPGGGGPGRPRPCTSPPCINPECPNPPCNPEDCQDGEEYDEETGECQPPECENSVGVGSCCFDQDQGNCVYVTCYRLVSAGDASNCCPSKEGEEDDEDEGESADCDDLVCPRCFPQSYRLCPRTTRHCYSGQDDDGYLVFSAGGSDVRFDPGNGQFIPPNPPEEPEFPEGSCENAPGYCWACIQLSCGADPDAESDGEQYIECNHGEDWLEVGIPGAEDLPRQDSVLGESFSNSVNICNDPNGSCTRFTTFRYCVCPPGPPDFQPPGTFASIGKPSCTVSWKKPGDLPPLESTPPGPGGGEWGSSWEFPTQGVPGGGPSSACDCSA